MKINTKDTLAERLRRRPAKPMGSPRVGSNPTGVVFVDQTYEMLPWRCRQLHRSLDRVLGLTWSHAHESFAWAVVSVPGHKFGQGPSLFVHGFESVDSMEPLASAPGSWTFRMKPCCWSQTRFCICMISMQNRSVFADGHTASNAPDLFRPPKLSGAGPG